MSTPIKNPEAYKVASEKNRRKQQRTSDLPPAQKRSRWRDAKRIKRTKALETTVLSYTPADGRALVGTSPTAVGPVKTHHGADCGDIYDPHHHQPAHAAVGVSDPRRSRVFCRDCKADVMVEQRDGRWIKVDANGQEHVCP